MDRRKIKTREAIFEAFQKLLSKKSYTRITVQEIIDEANIGRSTFYSHFETKDYLLKEMCTEIFDHVFSNALEVEKTHDFSESRENPKDLIAHILYHLKDNQESIITIMTCESRDLFVRYFKGYLNKMIVGIFPDPKKGLPNDFVKHHISSSFIEMVNWWISNKMAQSPEEMADYYLSVILPIYK
ncbi:MAG: TetR/AcrR family transcriptional regulator [Tissierellia bacterium]|nr:TetR/AcrR family transcriptional regulator [Tissierellia bacterium]